MSRLHIGQSAHSTRQGQSKGQISPLQALPTLGRCGVWGPFPSPRYHDMYEVQQQGCRTAELFCIALLCRAAYREYAAKGGQISNLLPNGCIETTDPVFLWQRRACTLCVQLTQLLSWCQHMFTCAASLTQPAKNHPGMGRGGRGKRAADSAAQLSLEGPCRKLTELEREGRRRIQEGKGRRSLYST